MQKSYSLSLSDILMFTLLIVTTLSIYYRVSSFDFIDFDDNEYITENLNISSGIHLKNIKWSFQTFHSGNWHPLTWISHMLDCQFFGMNAGYHHITNIFLHILNSLLLFAVLKKMTAKRWESFFVSILFALHPLHVESVAWISERKDLLCALFWMLTLLSYIYYSNQKSLITYVSVVFFFTLGLLSKPMIITLPFVLLLLDLWPLNRITIIGTSNYQVPYKQIIDLIVEKIPLVILIFFSGIITFYAQQQGGAVSSLSAVPFAHRIANVFVSYLAYILKTFYPLKLALLYPFPHTIPMWQSMGSALIILLITYLSVKTIKVRPYFFVGWMWYLGTLIPVIGIVQIGRQAMADRYTYIPLIGIFLIIIWWISDCSSSWKYRKLYLTSLSIIVNAFLFFITWNQIGIWKNSVTLFEHTLSITSGNYIIHNNLGYVLREKGKNREAEDHFRQAIDIQPNYMEAHVNLAISLDKKGEFNDAVSHYLTAIAIQPDNPEIHKFLADLFLRHGDDLNAFHHYRKVLELSPEYGEIYIRLGNILYKQKKIEGAVHYYLQALNFKNNRLQLLELHNNLGNAYYQQGKLDKAVFHYKKVLGINAKQVETLNNLGAALIMRRDIDEGITCFKKALEINPDHSKSQQNLLKALLLRQHQKSANPVQ